VQFWDQQPPARRQWGVAASGLVAMGLLRLGFAGGPASPLSIAGAPPMDGTVAGFAPYHAGDSDRFFTHGERFALSLSPDEMQLALESAPPARERHDLRLRWVGGRANARVAPRDPLPRPPAGLPRYASVAYEDVYPGIAAQFVGHRGELQYSFYVDRGASPGDILLEMQGVDRLDRQGNGALVATVGGVRLVHAPPSAYQPDGDGVKAVEVAYALRGPRQVGFEVGDYDIRRPLIVRYGRGVVTDAVGPQLAAN
jgi:hypothetical protein